MSTFDDNGIKLKPFYMWAGGKTRLLKYYRPIINTIMRKHNHITEYVEPFFGGGALYADMWNLYNNDYYMRLMMLTPNSWNYWQ